MPAEQAAEQGAGPDLSEPVLFIISQKDGKFVVLKMTGADGQWRITGRQQDPFIDVMRGPRPPQAKGTFVDVAVKGTIQASMTPQVMGEWELGIMAALEQAAAAQAGPAPEEGQGNNS